MEFPCHNIFVLGFFRQKYILTIDKTIKIPGWVFNIFIAYFSHLICFVGLPVTIVEINALTSSIFNLMDYVLTWKVFIYPWILDMKK